MVAVLGKLNGVLALENLPVSNVKRKAELCNLIACIVYVEFPCYLVACSVHNGGKAVAECTASCIAHMHRACRVGGNEFNVYRFTLAEIGRAVAVATLTHVTQNCGIIIAAEVEVDKACTCNLALFNVSTLKVEVCTNCIGNLPGCSAEGSCACHCGVGGKIAVGTVCRNFNIEGRNFCLGQSAVCYCFFKSPVDGTGELVLYLLYNFRHYILPLIQSGM